MGSSCAPTAKWIHGSITIGSASHARLHRSGYFACMISIAFAITAGEAVTMPTATC